MIRVHQLAPSVLEQIDVEIASSEHAIAPRPRAFLFLLALLRLPDLVNVDVARTAIAYSSAATRAANVPTVPEPSAVAPSRRVVRNVLSSLHARRHGPRHDG